MHPLTRHLQPKIWQDWNVKIVGPLSRASHVNVDTTTGQFIAAVCNSSNLQLKARRQRIEDRKNSSEPNLTTSTSSEEQNKYRFCIPVVMHNLGNSDAHHILRYFNPRVAAWYSKNGDKNYPPNVEITAMNHERFISLDIFFISVSLIPSNLSVLHST